MVSTGNGKNNRRVYRVPTLHGALSRRCESFSLRSTSRWQTPLHFTEETGTHCPPSWSPPFPAEEERVGETPENHALEARAWQACRGTSREGCSHSQRVCSVGAGQTGMGRPAAGVMFRLLREQMSGEHKTKRRSVMGGEGPAPRLLLCLRRG